LAETIRERFTVTGPIVVAPDGVDRSRFDAAAWRGGRTIVYVGQLYPWKGVDTLIRAVALLPAERARVVGGGEGAARLRALAEQEGCAERVHFTGQLPAACVPHVLADAGVAVVPGTRTAIASRFTSPLKLFEYMAAGVPIVAADVPAMREVLADGDSALLVAPEDPRALATAIRRVLDDPALARRLREGALAAVTGYGWDVRARRLLAAIEAAAGRYARSSA
ncbi:MAG: glycosyltransferase, partial [Candidatus Rokuibacteriota bacterium]